MNTMNIWYGCNENKWLSNLAARPFYYKGKHYVSVEMCYQTWKSGEFDSSTYKKHWKEGVKIPGRKGTKTRDNWNVGLMKHIMTLSFLHNPPALDRLKDLGDVEFTHRQDHGVWRTLFPTILKEIQTTI